MEDAAKVGIVVQHLRIEQVRFLQVKVPPAGLQERPDVLQAHALAKEQKKKRLRK